MPNEAVVGIVTEGFAATDREAGAIPARTAAFTGGHPQRVMQLADAGWRRTAPGTAAAIDMWDAAIGAAQMSTHSGFERLYSALAHNEKTVLRILASGGSLFGSAAELLDLHTGSA